MHIVTTTMINSLTTVPLSFMEYWDESSDSDSDDDQDYSSALWFDDLVNQGESTDDDTSWIYQFRSARGAAIYGNLPKRATPDSGFKLKYNPTNNMLLEMTKIKVVNSLQKARKKLGLEPEDPIGPSECVAAVIPRHFIEQFHI